MRNYRPYIFPVLLALLALILAILLWFGALPDLLFSMRIDLGNVVFFLDIVFVLFWLSLGFTRSRTREEAVATVVSEAADEKRRFLRRLDHELKNPLTAIRAGLANLAETHLDDVQRQALASVESQTLRLSRLSSDLRKLAELETRPLERTAVNIAEMLQEAYNIAQDQPNAAARALKLTTPQAPWPLPSIQGDRDLLFLAVHNLLDNAIKFTPPGGTIEMRGFEDGSALVLEVADTGLGIPEDELAHVGEELYRGRGARGVPGNGLGLSLVNAIIKRHGGKVSIRSREGKGTVVTLKLPLN